MEEGEVKEKVSSFDILPDANPVNVETFVSIKVRDEDLKTEKESSPSLEEREGTNSSTITDKDESLAIEPDIQSPSSQPETSTPIHRGLRMDTSQTTVQFDIDASSLISDSRFSVESKESILPDDIKVPIVGYEIMEERAKFTVFKVKVDMGENNSWFVFRRYTDFVHLNNRLKRIFPHVRFSLPPKRWFKDNFDKNFIEDRLLGLQAFVDNCTCHREISNCKPVREFFCFDDPPGPHESLEESRAVCESLEDTVYNLRRDLDEKDVEVKLLQEELSLYKKQVEMLTEALRSKNASTRSLESQETRSTKSAEFPETGSTKSAESPETGSTKSAESPERGSTKSLESPESPSSTSLAECDLMTCPEADQSHMQKSDVPAETKSKPTPEIQEKATNKKKEKSRSRFTFRKKSVS